MKKTQTFIKKPFNSISSDNLSENIKNSIKNRRSKKKDNSINITQKINYKLNSIYPKFQINLSSRENNKNDAENEKYYWFAAYDKLIKAKKLLKIFSFYNIASKNSVSLGCNNLYNNFNKIKEKKIAIKSYEIYFIKNMNTKPFIRYSEGKLIHCKLYLLTLKQINMIFSYINKIEYYDFFNSLDNIKEKEKNKYTNNLFENHTISLDYPTIYFLGSFMNIGIYTFSNMESDIDSLNVNNKIELDYAPNSKKIAKLIKILLINFPEYSKEYFINYIFSYLKNVPDIGGKNEKIILAKKNEINNLLISQKKSLYKISSNINLGKESANGNFSSGIPFSPYLSSFNNNSNNANINENNTNNNIIKKFNNNLGTISYDPSNFDFTSDYILSMGQNKENISKYINSIKNLSNRNKSQNQKCTKNEFSLSLSNNNKNFYLKNILNNKKIKEKSSYTYNINKKDIYKISNFSFENDSIINKNDYIKIKVNRKFNDLKRKTIHIKKEITTNIESYKMQSLPISNPKKVNLKRKINLIINNKNSKNSIDNINYTYNFNYIKTSPKIVYNGNKENYNSVSNFSNINFNDKRKSGSINNKNIININSQKSYLKGENIFSNTDNYHQKNNSSFMYILDKNGVSSYHCKSFRRNKGLKIGNQLIINKS